MTKTKTFHLPVGLRALALGLTAQTLMLAGCLSATDNSALPPVVSLSIPLLNDTCGVVLAEAEIDVPGEGRLGPFALNVEGDHITGVIEEVPAGEGRVVIVRASNDDDTVVYRGSAPVDIVADMRHDVKLVLERDWDTCPGDSDDEDGGIPDEEGATGELDINGALSNEPATPVVVERLLFEMSQGDERLLDVFVHRSGVVIVTTTSVRLLARDGSERDRWQAPRDISAAAMDGDLLGVADAASLTGIEVSADGLIELSTNNLVESCADAVMVSGGRFVCGPANDWQRVFYVFDLANGTQLSASVGHTHNGIPMRRVPGADAFVTVTTNLSPSDYHIYRVGEDDGVTYLDESPYHGDFPVSSMYAFDGAQPGALVNHQGRLLDLAGCGLDDGAGTTACLTQNGVLGTLSVGQSYIAIHNHGTTLHALVRSGSTNVFLQSIDISARTVLTETLHPFVSSSVIAMSWDPWAERVLLATRVTTTHYQVELLPLED